MMYSIPFKKSEVQRCRLVEYQSTGLAPKEEVPD